MKRHWILVLPLFLLGACHQKPIDRQEADNIARTYAKRNAPDPSDYRLYYYDDDANPIKFWNWAKDDSIVAYDAFVYFMDEHYHANWTHPCRYIVIQKQDGQYTIYHWTTTPRVDGRPRPKLIQI